MNMRNLAAPIAGLVAGFCIGLVDSRPTWDDTAVTAAAVFIVSLLLSAWRPRTFLLTALAVGLPIFLLNAVLNANFGSAAAIVIAVIGSLVGSQMRKLFGFGDVGRDAI